MSETSYVAVEVEGHEDIRIEHEPEHGWRVVDASGREGEWRDTLEAATEDQIAHQREVGALVPVEE